MRFRIGGYERGWVGLLFLRLPLLCDYGFVGVVVWVSCGAGLRAVPCVLVYCFGLCGVWVWHACVGGFVVCFWGAFGFVAWGFWWELPFCGCLEG